MIKRPFLIFILIISTLIGSLLWFIQSPQFVWVLKSVANRYLPKDIGIQGDFSDLSIRLFPPGFSIRNPKITLGHRNIAKLPAGSSVTAERIEFNFRPFQVLSGDIRVHEVMIINGDIHLVLEPPKPSQSAVKTAKPSKLDFHWDELFQVRSDSIALYNVNFSVQLKDSPLSLESKANQLRLSQWEGHGGLGYNASVDLENTKGSYLKSIGLPDSFDHIQGAAYLNVLGLQIESLFISASGGEKDGSAKDNLAAAEFSASGAIKGNLFDAKKLIADIDFKAKGSIQKFLKLVPGAGGQVKIPTGNIAVSGKLQGDLAKPMDTLQVEGQLNAKNLSYQRWKADFARVDLKWNASPTGGEVTLVKAMISAKEQPRIGGFQPGWGGMVEIGPARWVVGSTAPIKVPLRLEKAHIHWLGAGGIASVYPLDFRVNGTVVAIFSPPVKDRAWQLEAQLGLSLQPFQLDNQRFEKTKPLSALFKLNQVNVSGPVFVNSSEIRPVNVLVGFSKTQFNANGKINFKTGYDLYASGFVNLDDFKEIAENEVRGQGPVGIHVHGPSSGVFIDIDTDFKEVYYLKMALGSLKGRITWDDGLDQLHLSQMQLVKNTTHYSVDGLLGLGKVDTIDLKAAIHDGNIQDLIQIFDYMTHSLDWFPHDLQGPFNGTINVGGGIGNSKLKVLGRFDGRDWERWGERFRTVHLVGGYDCGKYYVSEFQGLKKTGKIEGRISYDQKQQMDWDFHTENFSLSDIDHVARLDIPFRGNLEFSSSGKGFDGAIQSATQVSLNNFTVRGTPMAPSQFSWKTGKGISLVQANAMGGQGVLNVDYNFNSKENSSIQIDLKQLDFSPILLLLNPKSLQDRALAGLITGKLAIAFHSGQIEKADGVATISEYSLARNDARFDLVNPISFAVSSGDFKIAGSSLKGRVGEVFLDLTSKNGQFEGQVHGDLDTALVEFFVPTVTQASGLAHIDFEIGGALKQPTLFGTAKFDGETVRISSFDSAFENVTGTLQLRQNVLSAQGIHADVGGGVLTVNGQATLFSDRYPQIDLKSTIRGSKIKVYPFQYAQVRGSVDVHGDSAPYIADGSIVVESALSKEKILTSKQGAGGLKALPYAPPPGKAQETSSSKFKLNIKVDADRGVLIQNDLFRDVEAKGNMTLVSALDSPRVIGHAEILHGKLLFKDHIFQIQTATANFDNPNVINPSFDLSASTEVNRIKIQMYASGRLDNKIKIEFSSNPAMPESEILSLLALGLTSSDAKKLSSTDQNAVQQGEVTSLLLHSLDFNRDFEDKTGFQFIVDESMNPQQGVSAFRPQSQTDSAAAPQITIRRKLTDRLSFSAGSTVGVGTNKQNQLNMDYSVNKDMSLSGVFTNYGSTGTADTQQTTQNSMGMDLKFQQRFK